MISKLVNNSGDVRALLGAPSDSRVPLDLSKMDWTARLLLNGLNFRNIVISGQNVNVNFVNCTFEGTCFKDVRAGDARFWGNKNVWRNCILTNVMLPQQICPYNDFTDCSFEGVNLVGWSAYKTKFVHCRFQDFHVEGFHADADRFENQPLADVSNPPPTLRFVDCKFLRPKFFKCRFSNVAFENCTVDTPDISFCDFTNARAVPKPWWESYQSSDPFVAFLYEVLDAMESKFGKSSEIFRKFEGYKNRYLSGETTSQDYSACLFESDVPEKQRLALEGDLSRLERKYAFELGKPH